MEVNRFHHLKLHARLRAGVVSLALLATAALSGCALIVPQASSLRAQWPQGVEQRAELEAVPFFPQKDYQCGPAALATAMAASGVNVEPDDLVSKVYLPSRRGSLQIEMMAAPRPYGLVSWQLAPRFEDVLREVQAGTPVIVLQDYGVWPVSYWHYAVVVGFDRETQKVILRSGEKRRLEIPLPVFEYTWKESKYWAIVTTPPDRIPLTASEPSWLSAVVAMERVSPRDAARSAYTAALARWPDSLNAAIALANIHYADGKLADAESVLRLALERHPKAPVALNNLAQVVADQNRPAEALKLVDEAIAAGGPFTANAQETREQILRKLAQPAHAAKAS